MKTLLAILALSAIGFAAATAQPGRGDGPRPRGDGPNRDAVAEQLGLTQEQKDALEAIRHDAQTEMVDLRAAVQKARLETKRLMDQPDASRDAILAAVAAEGTAQQALRTAMTEHQLAVRDAIGPEKAAQLRDLRREQMQERREARGSDDRGPGTSGKPGKSGPGGKPGKGGPGPDDLGW
jgi:Spy/CpxP family protein refolding chaperone